MATVSYTCHIQASPQVVYDASQDYERRYEWDPLPERIEFVDGSHTVEVGSRVRVIAKSRICIDVEFIQVSPPDANCGKHGARSCLFGHFRW
jgi:hypothetical protein